MRDGARDGDLHHPDATDRFRSDLAAGPIEDALYYHPASYGPVIAAHCEADPLWAATVAGVWLDDVSHAALPNELRRRIGIHSMRMSPSARNIRNGQDENSANRDGAQD